MIELDLYDRIRFMHAVEGMSQRKIARTLGISRNTVKRYCNGEHVPWERKSRHRESPIADRARPLIEVWLEEDELAPTKQRHTARRIYDRLREECGIEIGESTVRRLVNELRPASSVVTIPLEFDYGEAAQADWGEAMVFIRGDQTRVHLFCMRLCRSCAPFVAAFPTQREDSFLLGHRMGFEFLKGVPRRVVYDNIRTAVKEGWGRQVTKRQPRFEALLSHYAFRAEFCNPGEAHEKGLVEGLVGFARRNMLVPVPHVDSWVQLNDELQRACEKYIEVHQIRSKSESVREAFEKERANLTRLPVQPFDAIPQREAKVRSDSTVSFEQRRYSVPSELVGKTVTIVGGPFTVRILHRETEVAAFERLYGRQKAAYELEHYMGTLERKPRALGNALPVRQMAASADILELRARLQSEYPDKELLNVLKLILEYGEDVVSEAIRRALDNGMHSYEGVRYYILENQRNETELPEPLEELDTGFPKVRSVDLSQYNAIVRRGGRQ